MYFPRSKLYLPGAVLFPYAHLLIGAKSLFF